MKPPVEGPSCDAIDATRDTLRSTFKNSLGLWHFLRCCVAIGDQADLVWANISEILKEAHLELSDIVSIATYVVQGNDLAEVMRSRDENLQGHKPASTLVVVPLLLTVGHSATDISLIHQRRGTSRGPRT